MHSPEAEATNTMKDLNDAKKNTGPIKPNKPQASTSRACQQPVQSGPQRLPILYEQAASFQTSESFPKPANEKRKWSSQHRHQHHSSKSQDHTITSLTQHRHQHHHYHPAFACIGASKSACSSCIMFTLMLHQQHAHRHGPLLAGGIFEHSLKIPPPITDSTEVASTKRNP